MVAVRAKLRNRLLRPTSRMFRHETFPHAPITEALIHLKAILPNDVGMPELDAFALRICIEP